MQRLSTISSKKKMANYSMDRTADSDPDWSQVGLQNLKLHFTRASSAVGHVNRSAVSMEHSCIVAV
jgi:hypothetical protein